MDRRERIEARLREAFEPALIDVVDDSARHRGHAGAAGGGGHFRVLLVSDRFLGANRIERHRMVYDALSDEMHREVHALELRAETFDERNRDRLVARPEWRQLGVEHAGLIGTSLRELFERDPRRAERMSASACGLHFDYSKNLIGDVSSLLALADGCSLRERIDAMFRGDRINATEQRAALHVALRAPRGARIVVAGTDVVPGVHAMLERVYALAARVRDGSWLGHTGRRVRSVVNIGIGGSDLGPTLVCEALRGYAHPELELRFVSNVDPRDLHDALRGLDPAETLFIVVSKTFTTQETLTNARSARDWLLAGLGGDERAIAKHFVAVSTHGAEAARFGIAPENVLGFWDWVGGRYSLTSAVGLAIAIAIGAEQHAALLRGFHAMDEHFRSAPFASNLPLLHGLVSVWNTNFLGARACAILPYAQGLRRLPAYLQQLAMESNGKRVAQDGLELGHDTSPVWFGEPGTSAQHSFLQLIHQGTALVPCDFILFARPERALGRHQDMLVANALAQAEALAFGKTRAELRAEGVPEWLAPHREFPGNRPSNTILAERLTPETLGSLIAFYEHSVFTQGAIWDIDSFDQWGVELGKALADAILPELEAAAEPALAHDGSTNALIRLYRKLRG